MRGYKILFYILFSIIFYVDHSEAQTIANCERYKKTQKHLDQKYNVKCEYSLSIPLDTYAGLFTYTHKTWNGNIYNLPTIAQSPMYNLQTTITPKELVPTENSNCTKIVSYDLGPEVILANCPSNTSQIPIKIKARITESYKIAGYAYTMSTIYNPSYSNITFLAVFNSSNASGNGGNNGTTNNGTQCGGPYHGLKRCQSKCEDTGAGICRVLGNHKYSCECR